MNDNTIAQTKGVLWILEKIVKYVSWIIAFVIARYLGFFIVLLFTMSVVIGLWLPEWLKQKNKLSLKFIKFIAWSNVITWFLPPAGIFTGVFTCQAASYTAEQKKKYRILGCISILFAIINAAIGVALKMKH